MIYDGIRLLEGSDAKNLTIASGVTDPSLPNEGELFFRTDIGLGTLRVYAGGTWTSLGGGGGTWGSITGTLSAQADLQAALDDKVSAVTLTTKGDIFVRDASGIVRLPAGTDGHVLTANSSTTTGLEWAAASGTVAAPLHEIVFGTNTGVDSDSNFKYNPSTGELSVSGAVGSAGQVLTSNGPGLAATWQNVVTGPIVLRYVDITPQPRPNFVIGQNGTVVHSAEGIIIFAGGLAANSFNELLIPTAATSRYNFYTGVSSGATAMPSARYAAASVALEDGRIFICGGADASDTDLSSAIIGSGGILTVNFPTTWTTVAAMPTAVRNHAATRLLDGRVFVCGGMTGNVPVATARIYDPDANTWTTVASMPVAQAYLAAITLVDGRVAVFGSQTNLGDVKSFLNFSTSIYTYDVNLDTWTTYPAATLTQTNISRYQMPITLVDGRVMYLSGEVLSSFGAHAVTSNTGFPQSGNGFTQSDPNTFASLSGTGIQGCMLTSGGVDNQLVSLNVIASVNGFGPSDIDYFDVPVEPISTSGTGAEATVTVAAIGAPTFGEIINVVITNAGTGYTVGDTLTFLDSNLGNSGAGTGFVLEVTDVDVGGEILDVVINDGGSGYAPDYITYTNVPLSYDASNPGAGNGTGGTADVTIELIGGVGALTAAVVNSGGSNYENFEWLVVDVNDIGGNGTMGSPDAYFVITEVSVANSMLYAGGTIGGLISSNNVFGAANYSASDTVMKMIPDGINSTFVERAPLPEPRERGTLASIDAVAGVVLYVGGLDTSETATDTVWRYENATNSWTVGLAAAPTAKFGHASAELVPGTSVATFGGSDDSGTALDEVVVYDNVADSWTALADMPYSAFGLTAAYFDDGGDPKVFVCGGMDGVLGTTIKTTAAMYDIDDDTWTTVASLPVPLVYHSMVFNPSNQTFIVVGGFTFNEKYGIHSNYNAYIYTPASNVWTVQRNFSPTATAVHASGTAATFFNNQIYTIGGISFGFSNRVELYNFVPSAEKKVAITSTSMGVKKAVIIDDGRVYVQVPRTGMFAYLLGDGGAKVLNPVFAPLN